MLSSTSDAYLETQVLTATPQHLRLMLIEGAIRHIIPLRSRSAKATWIKRLAI